MDKRKPLLTGQMLRDSGVSGGSGVSGVGGVSGGAGDSSTLMDAVMRSLTLEPGAVVASEGRPADAILIVKRGGLEVSTQRQGLTLVHPPAQPEPFWSHLPVSRCVTDWGKIMHPKYATEMCLR